MGECFCIGLVEHSKNRHLSQGPYDTRQQRRAIRILARNGLWVSKQDLNTSEDL